ncbi:MAG: ComF family protein [Kofleriaceae bacterium]|nr:ComF family protein [Kofleriaceae bacterium]MBP6836278.1 ComF family protein [Kofleriaceae bacterium]MBP9204644.1 ComF family protein [Kofleriaceae bacterium]
MSPWFKPWPGSWSSALDVVLPVLFPQPCPGCAQVGPGLSQLGLCPPCAGALVELGPCCPACAEPLAGPVGVVCARCMRAPLPLGAITAPWRYGGPLADALQRLKFAGQAWVARGLAPAVGPFLDAVVEAGAIDVIVPVPLHWWRRTRRGFDQAALLAAAARPPAPVRPAMLRRVRPTRPQLELGRAARANNLVGAFVVPRRHRAALAGRRVLLVDDVVTTGATMAAAATALRRAGAAEVLGFAVARAER